MIVTGIDPGGTTGLVTIDWDGSPIPDPASLMRHDHVPFEVMPRYTEYQLFDPEPELLVIERFNISPRTLTYSRQPEPMYVIGGVLFAADNRGVEVRMQNPSDKDEIPDDQVREWAVKGKHAKDALRHVLLACHVHRLYRPPTDLTQGH